MDLRFADDAFSKTPELRYALQLYQAGFLESARDHLGSLLGQAEVADQAGFYLVLINEALSGRDGGGWTLNLPAGGPPLWEMDWIRRVFGPVVTAEVVDDRTGVAADRSLIVDYQLGAEKDLYYRRNFEHGVRQVLIHLGDERYDDSCSAYRWCQRIYRNIWSPILANIGHVTFFPLGYKTGFAQAGGRERTAAERNHLWSFAGDANKSTRAEMLLQMRAVPGGYEHLISGWDSADSLPTEHYRRLLDQSVFAPCPAGNSILDSFRVCEALEAGCIPIVERRPGYDYFQRLMPGHPMPTISHWSEGRSLVEALAAREACEPLRETCSAWWAAHKQQLIDRVRADLAA
jgi:Exostosin family